MQERQKSIAAARVELERLYGQRVDDVQIDTPEHATFKEECLAGIRVAEASFTSFAGSVRSIKGVLETCIQLSKLCLYFAIL